MTESTGHAVKDSTTGVGNMFHGILGGIGRTIQWCIILQIILVLVYINRAALLKFFQRKSSDIADQTTKSSTKSLTSTTNSHSPQIGFDNPTPPPDKPHVLPLVLASFILHDDSASQEKSGVVIPITVFSQNGHIPMLSFDQYRFPSYPVKNYNFNLTFLACRSIRLITSLELTVIML